ncbi:MAG: TerB family tellurite resistance protein [Bacteroidetes bacterium]|nr:TerB family tellurite resistance protein [Bacteroidota bacterium]
MANVSPLHELTLLYLAMAQGADDDLSYAERETVTDTLHDRYAYLDRAEVQNVVLETLTAHDEHALKDVARQVVDTLDRMLSDEEKKSVLEDLVRIAEADGVVLDRERRLLGTIAANWDVAVPPTAAEWPDAERDVASWSTLHHLAFIYFVLAHAPDSEFSAAERLLILRKLQEWEPSLDDDAVRAVMEHAMDRYARGPDPAMLAASIEAVKNALPAAQRKAALNDLIQIANVDGVFLDSEEDLLNDLVAAWGLDAFTDYGEEEDSNG